MPRRQTEASRRNIKLMVTQTGETTTPSKDVSALAEKLTDVKLVHKIQMYPVDKHFSHSPDELFHVYNDFHCTLVQKDVDEEKFFLIQLIVVCAGPSPTFIVWTRWGLKASLPSSLDAVTQSLITRIFDPSMFDYTMRQMHMSLTKLQPCLLYHERLTMALYPLKRLDRLLRGRKKGNAKQLEARYYELMPHDYANHDPPAIATLKDVRKEMDSLLTLYCMITACEMRNYETKDDEENTRPSNPLDQMYATLQCTLEWLNPDHTDYALVAEYFQMTSNECYQLLNVWRVDRFGEAERYKQHDELHNRKLLWYPTRMAEVAATLRLGCQKTPYTVGPLGNWIHLNPQALEAQTNGISDHEGHRVIFLAEAVLGIEEHFISIPEPFDRLKCAHSLVARGKLTSRDMKKITLDGKMIEVPCSKPEFTHLKTDLMNDFYSVLDDSQCRLRYLVEYK